MEENEEDKEESMTVTQKIKNLLNGDFCGSKSKNIIIVCGIVGIALIFLSTFIDSNNTSNNNKNISSLNTSNPNELIATYKENTEINLGNMIASIDGAGTTKIMVTVDSSIEYVYAKDTKESKDSNKTLSNGEENNALSTSNEDTYIKVRLSNGEEQVATVKEIQPKIRGVLVICEGGENFEVQQRVLNAVTKSLDISSAKVCVTKLSS